MKKRIISFFTALSMTFMLFDLPFDFVTVPVSAADSAPHVHDMSVSCSGSGVEFQPYHSGSPGPGNYYLTENVSHVAIWRIKTPGVYNLCLNGYSINPARIEIEENVTFNLCDCKGTGSITSFSDPGIYGLHGVEGEFNMYGGKLMGSGREDRQERGVSIIKNGKFTMYAGEITGYNGEDKGGVVVSDNGTFIMNGGKITNNTVQSEFAGAGVRSYGADSTIIINEGEISGNHGFGAEAWGRFEINGGKIINNDKGGVIVSKMPYISGSPVIKDNYNKDGKPFNLSLGNNKLHLLGPLGSDFEMGIASCDSSYIFTDNWNETMGDADPADYFTSDSDITKVKRYSDEGALCVLLTLDTSGWTGIVGDIPDPAYHPRFKEVELPMDLKLKGHIFGGWSEMKNRPQGSSSIELKGDTTVYPAFKACTHGSKGLVFQVDPTCTKTGLEKYVLCDYCGMTFESFSNLEPFEPGILPALGHDFGDWTTVEEATCTADGIKERVCKRNKCGQKETDIIPQTGHDFGTDYEKNETQHWQICTKCGAESEKSNHTWDDGEVTKSPSETEEGVMTYKCTICGKEKTEPIVNTEHIHDWGNWSITEKPTLTTTGTAERTCTKDSTHKDTKELPVLTDTTVWIKDDTRHVEPTDEEEGMDTYISEYGDVEIVLPKKEHTHDWGNWSITEKPTLTTTGTAERTCTKNSTHKDTKELPVLTDTTVWIKDDTRHVEPTEEEYGMDTYISEYGDVEIVLPKKEHTHSLVKTEAQDATCTTDGNEAYWTCSGCDKMFLDENGETEIDDIPVIPAGHKYSEEWNSDDNEHWHECTVCHDKKDTAAHTFVEGKCTVCQKSDPNYNQPIDTEPPVTDPSDTEPPVTEPPVTEPPITEPTVTAPPVTEPPITEPTVTAPPVTEPIVTNPPYTPYFPPNNAPDSAMSASREPFLQNENGKIGWDVISDNIWETPDGETVLVNMNGTNELPKNIVSDISGRDIDLVLVMNGGFVWTINGLSVTKAKTVNMGVRKVSKIPNSTVQKFFGDVKAIQIDLRHNGDFGFAAELAINIGNRYDGMYANSYCYKSRTFEFGDSSEIVNGYANLRFAHASSWLVTVESSPALEDVSTSSAAHSTGTPIDMSNFTSRGITVPEFDFKKKLKLSNQKRRYRILKKRRLDDLVFVL